MNQEEKLEEIVVKPYTEGKIDLLTAFNRAVDIMFADRTELERELLREDILNKKLKDIPILRYTIWEILNRK